MKEPNDSTTELNDSMKETNDSIKETNDSIKETNDSIKESNNSTTEPNNSPEDIHPESADKQDPIPQGDGQEDTPAKKRRVDSSSSKVGRSLLLLPSCSMFLTNIARGVLGMSTTTNGWDSLLA